MSVAFEQAKAHRLATFGSLVKAKVLSAQMAAKAAASGLEFHHFQLAHKRQGGIAGVQELSGASCRITKKKKSLLPSLNFF